MKKLLFLILSTTLIFSSCVKWDNASGPIEDQEVVFKSVEASVNNLKTNCNNPDAQYAKVKIRQVSTNDTTIFTPQIFYMGSNAYTQSIKLKVGAYQVLEFSLMNDNMTPTNLSDDYPVQATPLTGSQYASYVGAPLPFNTNVVAFNKNEIPIEVLCFEETQFEQFGFSWFAIDQVTVREQVFFGDLCVKDPQDYAGSLYAQQIRGLQVDMAAIFKIEVFRDNVFIKSFDNSAWKGEGQPLKVQYVDKKNQVNNFRFDLYILVRTGTQFTYKKFHSWSFTDAQKIPAGTDNVVDFVLGNCNINQADLVLAPYMNLPVTATYKITAWAPGLLGTYVDALLSNIPAGYELTNGTWPSWCGDKNLTIQINQNYNMDVYSTLYPALIPEFARKATIWPKVNWLMNNLNYFPTAGYQDIQDALWRLLNGFTGGSALAVTIANTASTNGANYVPLPGGWAAVIFVPTGTPINSQNPTIQTMFIRVDP